VARIASRPPPPHRRPGHPIAKSLDATARVLSGWRCARSTRSGSGRPSLLFEHAGHDGQVLLAQTLVNGLLPFLSQAGKDGEPVAAGRLEGEVHVLERERQRELGRELAVGDPSQPSCDGSPTASSRPSSRCRSRSRTCTSPSRRPAATGSPSLPAWLRNGSRPLTKVWASRT